MKKYTFLFLIFITCTAFGVDCSSIPTKKGNLMIYSYVVCENEESGCLQLRDHNSKVYYLKEDSVVGLSIQKAEYNKSKWSSIKIKLKPRGACLLEKITGENIGKRLAFVINDEVLVAPHINETISGGNVQISLGNDKRDGLELCRSIYKACKSVGLKRKVNKKGAMRLFNRSLKK